MKKRKKLIKRIGAVLCALVVAVSSMGYCVDIHASDASGAERLAEIISDLGLPSRDLPSFYKYILVQDYDGYYRLIAVNPSTSNTPIKAVRFCKNSSRYIAIVSSNYFDYLVYHDDADYSQDIIGGYLNTQVNASHSKWVNEFEGTYTTPRAYIQTNDVGANGRIVYSDFDIYYGCSKDDCSICSHSNLGALFYDSPYDNGGYNLSLGYLQNVRMNTVFDDVPLGENVGETYTTRWYYDQFSTTGIDLTSGDYFIRYYQERWIVKGYGADDVVEKSNRYILGDFIVQNGYIETYSVDVESTLHGQGYEEPSFIDLLWNKFVTTHYYFQIVDAKNNEVGGLLHIYLTDDNGKFGVEHVGETLDNEGNYDDSGYKDFIDDDSITSDDVEGGFEDLENGTSIDFGQIDGVDGFDTTIETYVEEMQNVTAGVRALLSSYPAWILGLLGLSFAFLIIVIIFKMF